jgi:hypothetical protein
VNEQGKYIASTAMYFMPGPGEGMVAVGEGEAKALNLEGMSEKQLKQAKVGKIEVSVETGGRIANPGASFATRAASEDDLYRLVLSDRGFDSSVGVGRLESAARTRLAQLEPEVGKLAGKADSELTRAEREAKSEFGRLNDFVAGHGAESAEAQVARLQERIPELKALKGKGGDVAPTAREAADFIRKYEGEANGLEKKLERSDLTAGEAAEAKAEIARLRERIDALDISKGNPVLTPKELDELMKSQPAQLKELVRKLPVSLPGAGGAMGLGFNTYAVVQIVLPDGRALAATGKYIGAAHAEQIAIAKLEQQLLKDGGRLPPGSRIVVVGDREVCSDVCKPDLSAFAERIGADRVDGYTYQRQKAVGQGLAGEKGTMRTMTQPTVQEKVVARTGINPDVTVPKDTLWKPEQLGLQKQHMEVWRRGATPWQ